MAAPRVFISYSHDSEEHKNWVKELTGFLRSKGIDAVLDQWDLGPGDDVAQFMEKGLGEAERVVVVCSENYVAKADEGKGGGGYEKMIVTGELVRNAGTNKFIPIIRANTKDNKVPVCLSSKHYVDFELDDEYENKAMFLVREVFGIGPPDRPALGQPPDFAPGAPENDAGQQAVHFDGGWIDEHRPIARKNASLKSIKTLWEITATSSRDFRDVSQVDLLAAARKSEIRTFGWPIGVSLDNRDEYRPRSTQTGILAEINIEEDRKSYDYWAWTTSGDFYLLKSLFEEERSDDSIFFNTRIVRTTEAVMYLHSVYEALGAADDDRVKIRMKYDGLAGKALSSSNPSRALVHRPSITEDVSDAEIEVRHGAMIDQLTENVQNLVAPMFVLFDFFELADSVYADIVSKFVNGHVS